MNVQCVEMKLFSTLGSGTSQMAQSSVLYADGMMTGSKEICQTNT